MSKKKAKKKQQAAAAPAPSLAKLAVHSKAAVAAATKAALFADPRAAAPAGASPATTTPATNGTSNANASTNTAPAAAAAIGGATNHAAPAGNGAAKGAATNLSSTAAIIKAIASTGMITSGSSQPPATTTSTAGQTAGTAAAPSTASGHSTLPVVPASSISSHLVHSSAAAAAAAVSAMPQSLAHAISQVHIPHHHPPRHTCGAPNPPEVTDPAASRPAAAGTATNGLHAGSSLIETVEPSHAADILGFRSDAARSEIQSVIQSTGRDPSKSVHAPPHLLLTHEEWKLFGTPFVMSEKFRELCCYLDVNFNHTHQRLYEEPVRIPADRKEAVSRYRLLQEEFTEFCRMCLDRLFERRIVKCDYPEVDATRLDGKTDTYQIGWVTFEFVRDEDPAGTLLPAMQLEMAHKRALNEVRTYSALAEMESDPRYSLGLVRFPFVAVFRQYGYCVIARAQFPAHATALVYGATDSLRNAKSKMSSGASNAVAAPAPTAAALAAPAVPAKQFLDDLDLSIDYRRGIENIARYFNLRTHRVNTYVPFSSGSGPVGANAPPPNGNAIAAVAAAAAAGMVTPEAKDSVSGNTFSLNASCQGLFCETDGRFYLRGLEPLLPLLPTPDDVDHPRGRRFRPEFLRARCIRHRATLSSDAITEWAHPSESVRDRQSVKEAHNELLNSTIPDLAEELILEFAGAGLGSILRRKLNAALAADTTYYQDVAHTSARFADDLAHGRKVLGGHTVYTRFMDEFVPGYLGKPFVNDYGKQISALELCNFGSHSLSLRFHRRGVNMCYLGRVYEMVCARLHPDAPICRALMEEMLLRTLKSLYRQMFRHYMMDPAQVMADLGLDTEPETTLGIIARETAFRVIRLLLATPRLVADPSRVLWEVEIPRRLCAKFNVPKSLISVGNQVRFTAVGTDSGLTWQFPRLSYVPGLMTPKVTLPPSGLAGWIPFHDASKRANLDLSSVPTDALKPPSPTSAELVAVGTYAVTCWRRPIKIMDVFYKAMEQGLFQGTGFTQVPPKISSHPNPPLNTTINGTNGDPQPKWEPDAAVDDPTAPIMSRFPPPSAEKDIVYRVAQVFPSMRTSALARTLMGLAGLTTLSTKVDPDAQRLDRGLAMIAPPHPPSRKPPAVPAINTVYQAVVKYDRQYEFGCAYGVADTWEPNVKAALLVLMDWGHPKKKPPVDASTDSATASSTAASTTSASIEAGSASASSTTTATATATTSSAGVTSSSAGSTTSTSSSSSSTTSASTGSSIAATSSTASDSSSSTTVSTISPATPAPAPAATAGSTSSDSASSSDTRAATSSTSSAATAPVPFNQTPAYNVALWSAAASSQNVLQPQYAFDDDLAMFVSSVLRTPDFHHYPDKTRYGKVYVLNEKRSGVSRSLELIVGPTADLIKPIQHCTPEFAETRYANEMRLVESKLRQPPSESDRPDSNRSGALEALGAMLLTYRFWMTETPAKVKHKADTVIERLSAQLDIPWESGGRESWDLRIYWIAQIAHYYQRAFIFSKAEPLYFLVMAMTERVYGPDSPKLADALIDFAKNFVHKADLDRAEPLLRRAMSVREKAFGVNSEPYVAALGELAALFKAEQDWTKAEELYARALSIVEDSLKLRKTHPLLCELLAQIADVYVKQAVYDKAEAFLTRLLRIREEQYGEFDVSTASVVHNLAVLYDLWGKHKIAEIICYRALRIREHLYGRRHPDVAETLSQLARCYDSQGHINEAQALYEESVRMREQQLGSDHSQMPALLTDLARVFEKHGEHQRAEQLLRRALELRDKLYGPEHRLTANSMYHLARNFIAQQNYTRGEALLQRAYDITCRYTTPDAAIVAATYAFAMGSLYVRLGDLPKAELYLTKSMEARSTHLSPEHPDTVSAMQALAATYLVMNQPARAEPLLKKLVGRSYPDLLDVLVSDPMTVALGPYESTVSLEQPQNAAAAALVAAAEQGKKKPDPNDPVF